MTGLAQTKGLFKELNPMFLEIKQLDRSLQQASAELTEEELVKYRLEIEDIKAMITYLLLKILAERLGIKT